MRSIDFLQRRRSTSLVLLPNNFSCRATDSDGSNHLFSAVNWNSTALYEHVRCHSRQQGAIDWRPSIGF